MARRFRARRATRSRSTRPPGFALGSRLLLSVDERRRRSRRTKTLPNNTYYWRVRGVDPQGQAGPWNNGPAFTKTYDETVLPGPANLTVYNSQLDPIADGDNVNEPVVIWDTVPGRPQLRGAGQLHRHAATTYFTANTAWTPLAATPAATPCRRS